MNNIPDTLKRLRAEKGWTQQDIAGRLFVTRQAVSNWENGKTEPDTDTLIKIAEVFQVDITEIIQGQSSASSKKAFMHCDKTFVLYILLFSASLLVRILMTSIDHGLSYSGVITDSLQFRLDLYQKLYDILLPLYAVSIGLTEFTAAALAAKLIKYKFIVNSKTVKNILSVIHTVLMFFIVLHFTAMFTAMFEGSFFTSITGLFDSLPEPISTIKGFLKYSALMKHRRWHFAVLGCIYEFTQNKPTE